MEANKQSGRNGSLLNKDIDEISKLRATPSSSIYFSSIPSTSSPPYKKQHTHSDIPPFRYSYDPRIPMTERTSTSDLLSQTLPLFAQENRQVIKLASSKQEVNRKTPIESKKTKEKPLSGTLLWLKQEMESSSKRLETRRASVRSLVMELGTADCNTILFKNKLLKELSSLDSDLKESSSNITVLMNDRIRMVRKQEELQEIIKKLREENKSLNEKIGSQGQSLSQIQEDLSILKEENEYLMAQNSNSKKMIENCQGEKLKLEEALNYKNSEIGSLQNQIRELNFDLGNRTNKLKIILQEMQTQQNEIKKLVEVVGELRTDNKNLSKYLEQAVAGNDELEAILKNEQKENERLKQTLLSISLENTSQHSWARLQFVSESESNLPEDRDVNSIEVVIENPEEEFLH